ncbi:MAG: hypothetical protein ACYCSA_00755 [Thermoplasmataceae archaeon]
MELDYKSLLEMDDEDRKKMLTKFLVETLEKNEEEQITDFQEMIVHTAKEYNDREYIDLCKVILTIIYSMDEQSIKKLMEARLEANFELEDLFEKSVDSTNLLKAIEELPQEDRIIDILKKYGILP